MAFEQAPKLERSFRKNSGLSRSQVIDHDRLIAFAFTDMVHDQAPASIREPIAFRAFDALQILYRRNVCPAESACQLWPAVDLDIVGG